ncbi:unnamed protein product [Knipowitschia caucasica]
MATKTGRRGVKRKAAQAQEDQASAEDTREKTIAETDVAGERVVIEHCKS